jgi:hypothetical protein
MGQGQPGMMMGPGQPGAGAAKPAAGAAKPAGEKNPFDNNQ